MTDNSMYWPDQSGWYQQQAPPHGPPPPYQSSPYSSAGSHPGDLVSPVPQNQAQQTIPNGSTNGTHISHMQSPMPQPTPPDHSPNMLNYNQQQQHVSNVPPTAAGQQQHMSVPNPQMQPIETSPSGYQMQQTYLPPPLPPQQQQQSQQHQHQQQPLPPQHQMYAQPQQQQHHHQHPQNHQPNTGYATQSNSVPSAHLNNGSHNSPPIANTMQPGPTPPINVNSQQQYQQPPPHPNAYPQQQYSPNSYWNPVQPPMQNNHQPIYSNGSATQSQSQMHQGGPVSTPPTPLDNSAYNGMNGPIAQQGMSVNYNGHYQQGYHSSHEMQHHQPPPQAQPDPYVKSSQPQHSHAHPQPQHHHHHQSNPNQGWSNGYYQPNQTPYPQNAYSYNGMSNIQSGHPQAPPPMQPMHGHHQNHHIPPNHMQHQHQHQHQPPMHQAHQMHPGHGPPATLHHYNGSHPQGQYPQKPQLQQQHWAHGQHQQNHTMPIIERNAKGVEKKPVKPRAPKKQANPNATPGRRKRPYMTEEHKHSGYAKFYQIKRKEVKSTDFGHISKVIAEMWSKLSEEEKSTYVKDVSVKRKEMLKKKASQQAQDLLVQGITQEQDVLIQGMKKEQ